MKKRDQLRRDLRDCFDFEDYTTTKFFKFSRQNPELTLVVSILETCYLFFLVDLPRRKILKSTSITVLDLVEKEGIEDLVRDPLQRHAGENQEGGGGEEHPNNQIEEEFTVYLVDYAYLPQSASITLLLKFNNLDIICKIDDIFSSKSLKDFKMVKRRKFRQGYRILNTFGGDKVLIYYSGKVRSTFLRPLAWLDMESFEETKIPGFDKEGRSHLLFGMSDLKGHNTQLNQDRILVLNRYLAVIYDFKQDKAIAEHIFNLQRHENLNMKKCGNLYAIYEGESLNLLRTEKSDRGEEVIEKSKIIHFNDLIPNMNLNLVSFGFNLLKLDSGNYLYLGSKYLEEDFRLNPTNRQSRLMSVEIDPETLSVIKFNVSEREQFDSRVVVSNVQLLKDLLIFNARLKGTQIGHQNQEQGEEGGGVRGGTNQTDQSTSLVLATTDFMVLDYCSESKLGKVIPIIGASSSKIASLGLQNKIYLHKVDFTQKRLILLKTLDLGTYEIIQNRLEDLNPSAFCCLAKQTHQDQGDQQDQGRILLKFDMDLNLISHLRINQDIELQAIYPLEGSKVAFMHNLSYTNRVLFVMDMEDNLVQFAHQKEFAYGLPSYVFEGEDEQKIMVIDKVGDKIVRVVLN